MSIERALLIAFVGTTLAVTIPAFIAHLRVNKIDEAGVTIDEIARAAQAYYQASHRDRRGQLHRHCLPSATEFWPPSPSPERRPFDFADEANPSAAIFTSLGLAGPRTLRFSYAFVPSRSGCEIEADATQPLFTIRAMGDLDGDGERSLFERTVRVDPNDPSGPSSGVLRVMRRVE